MCGVLVGLLTVVFVYFHFEPFLDSYSHSVSLMAIGDLSIRKAERSERQGGGDGNILCVHVYGILIYSGLLKR